MSQNDENIKNINVGKLEANKTAIKNNIARNKTIISIISIILIVFLVITVLISPKREAKKFATHIYANIILQMRNDINYSINSIDELEHSIYQSNLMKELDEVKIPKIKSLENAVIIYKMNSADYSIALLESKKMGVNPVINSNNQFNIYMDSVDVLFNEIKKLEDKYNLNLKDSLEVEEEVKRIINKIN